MEALSAEVTTAQYVQRFFSEYIERVFIGDYRELRTREHPLSRRSQILRSVEELRSTEAHRERLVTWYQGKRCGGDRRKAEQLFEKDIFRLEDLKRIDEYLDRLDDEIRRANRRALAFLDYRLRSLRPIDLMVKHAIEAALAGKLPELGDPFPPGELISGERLAEPRKLTERTAPSSLRRNVPSEEERARSKVMLRLRENLSITPPKLAQFVIEKLGEKTQIISQMFTLKTIEDVRAYQTLARIGLEMSSDSRRLQLSALTMAKGFRVRLMPDLEPEGSLISGKSFTIERNKMKSEYSAEKRS